MSRAYGAARFPDGRVRFFLYDGTSDIVWPALFDTPREAWDDYGATWPDEDDSEPGFEVDLYSDYGGGWSWRGRATERFVLPPLTSEEMRDADVEETAGQPGWLP